VQGAHAWNPARGDLGPSFKHANRSVNELIAAALPVSLELGGIALCIALLVGIPLGITAAVRQNTWIDYLASTTAMAGICLPTFVMGPLLVLVFALHFEQFNASGWDFARDRVLPALTLGLVYAGYIARAHARRHARSAEPGLHPDRARQGRLGDPRGFPACAARRTAARGVVSRPGDRGHPHGVVRHRDDLQYPGPRPALRHQRFQPRRHAHDRHRPVLRRTCRRLESRGDIVRPC
jgi:hypothetical protein